MKSVPGGLFIFNEELKHLVPFNHVARATWKYKDPTTSNGVLEIPLREDVRMKLTERRTG
jgi:hypothetical protein